MDISLEDYRAKIGSEVGVSDWVEIDQSRIDAFADTTEDFQFIHVDPDKARDTPFGGTIAHGFLTLSMLVKLGKNALPQLSGRKMSVNYGFDKIRFMAPVPAGARIRGRFVLEDIVDRGPDEVQTRTRVTVEIEGRDKPALVAEWLGISYF